VISQAPSTIEEGSVDMLTASLLETIISAGSIVRPTPRLAECTASIGGLGWMELVGVMCGQLQQGKSKQHSQPRRMIACCVRRSTPQLFWAAVSEKGQWVDAVLK